jgi:hypothetical protein
VIVDDGRERICRGLWVILSESQRPRTQLHPAARALRGRRPGLRAARAVELHAHTGRGTKLTCAQAVSRLLRHKRRWEVRSAGHGSKGERWYAWAWLATASPRHHLLARRQLRTGELAFCYCWVPGSG